FDTGSTSLAGGSTGLSAVPRSYNAFFNTANSSQLSGTSGTDRTLTALTYTNGPDASPWYVNASTPTLYQVDTSRNSAAAGLYHYTVLTNQTKAAANNGSIGF